MKQVHASDLKDGVKATKKWAGRLWKRSKHYKNLDKEELIHGDGRTIEVDICSIEDLTPGHPDPQGSRDWHRHEELPLGVGHCYQGYDDVTNINNNIDDNEITDKKKKRRIKFSKKKVRRATWKAMKGSWKFLKVGLVTLASHPASALGLANPVTGAMPHAYSKAEARQNISVIK